MDKIKGGVDMENYKQQQRPYGFYSWLTKLWQVGIALGIWNYSVLNYKQPLDNDGWLHYFNEGLSPKDAILTDIKEQP